MAALEDAPAAPKTTEKPAEKSDTTKEPEQKDKDDWKNRGERVEGTSAVRKVNGN